MTITAQHLTRQLGDLRSAARIVFVHPNYHAQHLVLSHLLERAVYVRFQGHSLDDAQLQSQLDDAVRRQTGNASLAPETQYLVLDEVDRGTTAALIRLLRRLPAEIPGTRILVLSRVLLADALEDEQIRSQAAFIPDDPKQMLWDYADREGEFLLEVRAFGEGRVHVNGRSVDTWDGALPRALFFYLIDRGMVTRAEIFQTFWPNLSTREATNVFHVTKRKISEVLDTELTVYGSSFYHISPRIQLSYDVSLFNQLVQESEDESSGDALRQALALYRGDYLTSLKADWVLTRRDALQQAACDALVALGRICEAAGKGREALAYYLRRHAPLRRAIHAAGRHARLPPPRKHPAQEAQRRAFAAGAAACLANRSAAALGSEIRK
jgi:hypothetical protein